MKRMDRYWLLTTIAGAAAVLSPLQLPLISAASAADPVTEASYHPVPYHPAPAPYHPVPYHPAPVPYHPVPYHPAPVPYHPVPYHPVPVPYHPVPYHPAPAPYHPVPGHDWDNHGGCGYSGEWHDHYGWDQFPGHHYEPAPIVIVHPAPWPHWEHPVIDRPIYEWDWPSLVAVTCAAADAEGNIFPVTHSAYSGIEYQEKLPMVEDEAIDRCHDESPDGECRLIGCDPGYN